MSEIYVYQIRPQKYESYWALVNLDRDETASTTQ